MILKYLKALFLLKDITSAYEEEKKNGKPWYLTKRFIGAVVIFLGYLLTTATGVDIDSSVWTQVTESLEKAGAALVLLYGIVMELAGIIQAILRKVKSKPA